MFHWLTLTDGDGLVVAEALQWLGLGLIAVGAFLVWVPLGLFVTGACVLAVGVLMDPRVRRRT